MAFYACEPMQLSAFFMILFLLYQINSLSRTYLLGREMDNQNQFFCKTSPSFKSAPLFRNANPPSPNPSSMQITFRCGIRNSDICPKISSLNLQNVLHLYSLAMLFISILLYSVSQKKDHPPKLTVKLTFCPKTMKNSFRILKYV